MWYITYSAPMPSRTPNAPGAASRARLLEASVAHLAEHGVAEASLRQIAAAIGTSHRMLIYHFGSRQGLLEAVVDHFERDELEVLRQFVDAAPAPTVEQAMGFWTHLLDAVDERGALFFELTARAMQSQSTQDPLRVPNLTAWVETLQVMWTRVGIPAADAQVWARLNLAVARGLLHDYLLTRDRDAVNRAMQLFSGVAEQTALGR